MSHKKKYTYESVRPKLWEVQDKKGRALGRIRHVFKPKKRGWLASNGEFYRKAKNAAMALLDIRQQKLQRA